MYLKKLIFRGNGIVNFLFNNVIEIGDSWIAGSFARWAFSPLDNPVKPSDVDIFCRDQKTFDILHSRLIKYFKVRDDNPACITYLKNPDYKNIPPIQLIKPRIQDKLVTQGDIETILNNFDFTVTRAAIINNREGIIETDFEGDEQHKKLRIKNIHCPVSSTYRVIKYCNKGYKITTGEIAKIFADWDARPDEYKLRLLGLLSESDLTQDEIDELEKLLRID